MFPVFVFVFFVFTDITVYVRTVAAQNGLSSCGHSLLVEPRDFHHFPVL